MKNRFRHTREPMSYNYSCIVDDETGRVVKWAVENEKAAAVCALLNLAAPSKPVQGQEKTKKCACGNGVYPGCGDKCQECVI